MCAKDESPDLFPQGDDPQSHQGLRVLYGGGQLHPGASALLLYSTYSLRFHSKLDDWSSGANQQNSYSVPAARLKSDLNLANNQNVTSKS